MADVATSTIYMPEEPNKEPENKKIKSATNETNEFELKYRSLYKRHIHVIFDILDTIDAGHKDDTTGMMDTVRLAQLTTKYFFWSMIEEGKCVLKSQ